MSADEGTTPQGSVRPRELGANGLPEVGREGDVFEAFGDVGSGVEYPGSPVRRDFSVFRSDYLPWIAAGAVVVGLVGAFVGCMRYASPRRSGLRRRLSNIADSHGVTPPHGDKLVPRE